MNNQERPGYYGILPASVRYDNSLHAMARILYSEITALCQKEGYCWASNGYFADLYGVTDRSVINWINNLREKNYIKTQLIYKNGSKEVKERRIYISDPLILKNLQITNAEGGENNFTTPGENQELKPSEKKFTRAGEKKFLPSEKKFTDNNKPLSSLISISSIEDAKKYFSEKGYKSNYKKFFLHHQAKKWKGIKDRFAQADLWEENSKDINPDLHVTKEEDKSDIEAENKPILIEMNDDPFWIQAKEKLMDSFEIEESWKHVIEKLVYFGSDTQSYHRIGITTKFFRDWLKNKYKAVFDDIFGKWVLISKE